MQSVHLAARFIKLLGTEPPSASVNVPKKNSSVCTEHLKQCGPSRQNCAIRLNVFKADILWSVCAALLQFVSWARSRFSKKMAHNNCDPLHTIKATDGGKHKTRCWKLVVHHLHYNQMCATETEVTSVLLLSECVPHWERKYAKTEVGFVLVSNMECCFQKYECFVHDLFKSAGSVSC